jgi:LEA14-like dessication related protein
VQQIGEVQLNIKNDTIIASSKLTVKNKSFLKIKIDTLSYKLSLFNKTYMHDEKPVGIELNGYEMDTIGLSLIIPYKTIMKDLKVVRKENDSSYYSISIHLQYSTIFGNMKIPINKSAKFKIPQPPDLSIVAITYKKIHFKYILAEVKIKIINYGNLSLSIKDLSYSMNILKQGNLKGKSPEEIIVKPKETSIVILPIKININNVGKTLFEVIMNKDNYNYTLNLNALLEVSNPLKESYNININHDGIMELVK